MHPAATWRSFKGGSSAATSSGTSQTGFFVAAPTNAKSFASEEKPCHVSQENSFWLRSFVEKRQSERSGDMQSADSEGYEERAASGGESVQFCGITTRSHQGIVDTAAEGGLIGSEALERLQVELQRHGLRCKWTPKITSAKGVGGSAKVIGVVLIPVGIGKSQRGS